MDTLIRLNIKTSYKGGYNNNRRSINISLKNFYKLYSESPIFEFKEYSKVEISFDCDDKDTTLKIEVYQGEDEKNNIDNCNEYFTDENMKVLRAGECTTLCPGGDLEDMLVPGKYSIQIYRKGNCFDGFFNIIPNTVDWDAIVNIRQYLEKKVKGLSYNIYLEKRANKQNENYLHQDMEAYRYLDNIQDKLLSFIKGVTQNPILDIKKEYINKKYSKNPDSKSQRWILKKGNRYNYESGNPKLFYEKHSYTTNNNIENIILKRMLNYFQTILIEAESEYTKILNTTKNYECKLNTKLKNKHILYEKASRLPNTNKVNKIRQFHMENLNKEINECREKRDVIERHIKRLYKLKGKLNYYVNETWINNVELKYNTPDVTLRILKNYYYNEIYSIYRQIRLSNKNGSFDIVFPNKKTSKLFEIYSFLITKDIFEILGFTWIEGWIKSAELNELFNGDLASGDSIIMEKDDYKLVIAYDIYIGTPDELRDVKISQPSTKADNHHRRPDILISLYKGTKLLGCEVIEVKYRRKYNIYNNRGIDTDVCKQLSSYTGFDYYDAQKGRVTRIKPVYKVLTLYPKQDNLGQEKHSIYDIEFIPIMPRTEDASMYYGYENLKRELEEFLSYYMD